MRCLELLSPARNKEIGIAAIDCGADAVYIAGPNFGARKDAGNSFEDIALLCEYAHKFGARVFVTFNTSIRDDEVEELHHQMLQAQEAGADAFIVRDERIFEMKDITVPLHASTQCAIRDADRARHFEEIGSARIVLERELSLKTIRQICDSVNCEVEFFVHGALCVCYSGECRLSEYLNGRSADRGECIQACRSLYDLEDAEGNILVKNKALLSLKDYNLYSRLEELAEVGVISFKIEGRLKNASYVKNVVRAYSMALDDIVARHPDKYRRASFGVVRGGFAPDLEKTFNRGYTELFIDGKRGQWSSMNAPKSMGEEIGSVTGVRSAGRGAVDIMVKLRKHDIRLANGDGFAFVSGGKITGFRGDKCEGTHIFAKSCDGLRKGTILFRNISAEFERMVENQLPRRELHASIYVQISGEYTLEISVASEDGREVCSTFRADVDSATDRERATAMLREQLSKRSGHYAFNVRDIDICTKGGDIPLLSASTINSIRRLLASDLDDIPCKAIPLALGKRLSESIQDSTSLDAYKESHINAQEPAIGVKEPLMLSKYCIRYELGMCPRQRAESVGSSKWTVFSNDTQLFLRNNGKRLALHFDCTRCEMRVEKDLLHLKSD